MTTMDEQDIIKRIHELVDDEERIRSGGSALDDEERERVERIEVALDQCWDLLRQRRARREFREDPDDAAVRDADVVEGYVQ